jgi:hypothetical protein
MGREEKRVVGGHFYPQISPQILTKESQKSHLNFFSASEENFLVT